MWRKSANEGGATTIEYALLAAGIAMVIVAAVAAVGPVLVNIFSEVSAGFN